MVEKLSELTALNVSGMIRGIRYAQLLELDYASEYERIRALFMIVQSRF